MAAAHCSCAAANPALLEPPALRPRPCSRGRLPPPGRCGCLTKWPAVLATCMLGPSCQRACLRLAPFFRASPGSRRPLTLPCAACARCGRLSAQRRRRQREAVYPSHHRSRCDQAPGALATQAVGGGTKRPTWQDWSMGCQGKNPAYSSHGQSSQALAVPARRRGAPPRAPPTAPPCHSLCCCARLAHRQLGGPHSCEYG
jgi:hypothetical protein